MRYAITQDTVDRGCDEASASLGAERYAAELERGSGLSLPETIDLALEALAGLGQLIPLRHRSI